jgi:hypothetical protein
MGSVLVREVGGNESMGKISHQVPSVNVFHAGSLSSRRIPAIDRFDALIAFSRILTW